MVVLIDTRTLAAKDRLGAIFAAMEGTTAPCEVRYEDDANHVFTRIEAWQLGGVDIWRNEASGMRMTRTAQHLKVDLDGRVAIAVQESGRSEIAYTDAGTSFRAGAGSLVCVDLTKPYDYAWSDHGSAFCVSVPLDQLGLSEAVVQSASQQLERSPIHRLFQQHLLGLATGTDALIAEPGAASLGSASVELLRALLASASHDDSVGRSALSETLLTQVRAYVHQHLHDLDLTPESIARVHHVSTRQLFRICAQNDFSLHQWIMSKRLDGARDQLASPNSDHQAIATVARHWGFRDPGHFSRRFKTRYGITPRDWRQISYTARGSD